MTTEAAYSILGVDSNSSGFEQILAAKNKMLAVNKGNKEKCSEVETAYDVLFMQSMKKRISGELEVSTSVRYADVPTKKRSSSQRSSPSPQQTALLQKVPGGLTVETPKQSIVAGQSAVFAACAVSAVIQLMLESPDVQAAETGALQMGAAFAFAIYCFREYKKLSFGRAIGLTTASFVAGIMIGSLVNAWLNVDIVPLGPINSAGVFVAEFAIVSMWASCLFLA